MGLERASGVGNATGLAYSVKAEAKNIVEQARRDVFTNGDAAVDVGSGTTVRAGGVFGTGALAAMKLNAAVNTLMAALESETLNADSHLAFVGKAENLAVL